MKMIFSDFDNTMLNYYSDHNEFDDYKISVLSRIQDEGIKFCIVTGRCVSFFKRFPKLLENVDYILGSNGACIYDVKNDKFLYHKAIDKEDFRKVISYLLRNHCSFLLNCKEKRYCYDIFDVSDCLEYKDGTEYLCEQMILRVSKEKFDELFCYLEEFSNLKVNNISTWDEYYAIDINHKNISKGNSVVWLCNYLGIDIDDVIAFGDGDNDQSMFEVVNNGVAVGNAVDKLKVLSKEIALDCESDGIYKYIEEKILK